MPTLLGTRSLQGGYFVVMSERMPWLWPVVLLVCLDLTLFLSLSLPSSLLTARGKDSVPANDGSSSGAPIENHQDRDKEREKEKVKEEKRFARKSKKEKEALRSPVEAHPPPGPLVALGRPKDKIKRPRCVGGAMGVVNPSASAETLVHCYCSLSHAHISLTFVLSLLLSHPLSVR